MSENKGAAPKAPKTVIEIVGATDAHDEGVTEKAVMDGSPVGTAGAGKGRVAPNGFRNATFGLFEGLGRAVWAYADAHPHAVLYGIFGFVLAVLLLTIGLWDTIVIAAFVAVGTIIGRMVDGDNAVVNFIGRLINGR